MWSGCRRCGEGDDVRMLILKGKLVFTRREQTCGRTAVINDAPSGIAEGRGRCSGNRLFVMNGTAGDVCLGQEECPSNPELVVFPGGGAYCVEQQLCGLFLSC
jgi:hypothetical protein